jgi:hypothetical protein
MSADLDKRDAFLLQMYQQMWNNINRHILVVWQSVGVLGGAFAVAALVEKQVISLNWAATILILASGWECAHSIDASNWYNRNIAIIGNIERQFLSGDDQKLIHPYFGKHREPKLLDHLRIQVLFGAAVGVLVLVYHFEIQVLPCFGAPWSTFDWHKAVPYAAFSVCAYMNLRFYFRKRGEHLAAFSQSPNEKVVAPSSGGA